MRRGACRCTAGKEDCDAAARPGVIRESAADLQLIGSGGTLPPRTAPEGAFNGRTVFLAGPISARLSDTRAHSRPLVGL